MAHQVRDVAAETTYSQVRRFGYMFEASLETPTPPTAVAEKIRQIIESGTQKLRHPVGADAEGFLGWRASMTDDEWVAWAALSDEDWYDRVASEFGLDARAKRQSAAWLTDGDRLAARHARRIANENSSAVWNRDRLLSGDLRADAGHAARHGRGPNDHDDRVCRRRRTG